MKTILSLLMLVLVKFICSQSISAGLSFTLFLCEDNTVKAVGSNTNGQLGLGSNININIPQTIQGLNDIIAISAGINHSLFLKNDGTVWATGKNDRGQLGDGTYIDKNLPVQVMGLSGIVAIAGGNDHSLFLKSDSTVWSVGFNMFGQLGDSSNINKNIPVQVKNLTNVKSIYASGFVSMFLKHDGTVWGTGQNWNGQLGDGSYTNRNQVVLVQGINGVTKIALGFYHTIFLKYDQTLWGVGSSLGGQLGDTNITQTSNAFQLQNLPNIIDIKANGMFSMFLSINGDVWATGNNPSGGLADGTFVHKYLPILIPSINDIKSVAVGQLHTIFQKNDGTVWACGDNVGGGLGNGQNLNINLPTQTLSLCNISEQLVSSNLRGVFGEVFLDLNENCIRENEFTITPNILGIIVPGNIVIQTLGNGYWYIDSLPAGNYSIYYDSSVIWKPVCSNPFNFTVLNSDEFLILPPFAFENTTLCTQPKISIRMPSMRPCFNNQQIYVQACNEYDATVVLPDAYSLVELDPNLIFESASLPYTSLGNNQYRFEHGTLYPGQCVNYAISAQVDCNASLGLTLCLEANLYPVADCVLDTIPTPPSGEVTPCTLPWDQSSLSVNGWCANDSIYFTITNTGQLGGGDMECYSPVRVFVDGVPYLLDSIMLLGGETFTYVFAGNGATWILEADQHPLHPGNSHPNAHVENCNPGNWTPDIVNNFPQDDADPVKDIYCGVVTGSYDPNDKKGTPYGLGAEHEVLPNQDIEYLIRFQNTGTDTAFTVVVRDTLDLDFDIFSVTSGSASHNYSFRMYGPRVLEWTFSNILLPDSTTNEVASHGFLSYRVKQKPNLADGTLLTNDADIYFDFNSPIITNETSHKVQRRTFEPTNSLVSLSQTKTGIKVYPNPTKQETTLSFTTYQKQVSYQLMNISGQVLLEKSNVSGKDMSINLAQLPDGMYFVKVETNGAVEMLKVLKE